MAITLPPPLCYEVGVVIVDIFQIRERGSERSGNLLKDTQLLSS